MLDIVDEECNDDPGDDNDNGGGSGGVGGCFIGTLLN